MHATAHFISYNMQKSANTAHIQERGENCETSGTVTHGELGLLLTTAGCFVLKWLYPYG